MGPLAMEIIDKLNKEEDPRILAEVLDFYEYLKQKKQKKLQLYDYPLSFSKEI